MLMIHDAYEATHCKVNGLKRKQWFIRLVGTHYIGDLCDPGTKGRASWVQNI
jgi:hypothetical protein